MELNNYNNFSNHFKDNARLINELKIKYEEKEADTMDGMEQIIQRKDSEIIDHNLLAPEYMRDPNTFIIDLINFPKPINPSNNNSNNVTEDIHFPNTLFTENSNSPTDESCKAAAVYMPLNSGFLIPVQKTYLPSVETAVENETKVVQQLLLNDTNVTLDEGSIDEDCDISRFNSRPVLPHKKRISRKLKTIQDESELNLNVPLEQHKLLHGGGVVGGNMQFRCELCGHNAGSQLEFYVHLKQHYEPATSNTFLSAMKMSLDDVRPIKSAETNTLCNIDKKQTDGLDQVLQDVQFPFENFTQNAHDVNNVGVVMESGSHTEEQVDLKIVNKVLEEAMNGTTTTLHPMQASSGQTQPTLVAEEFSDTEDMLEGIRDKVFIEDTCDAMDLMTPTPNGVRPHSFINSCFPGIELKTKPFCDVLFSGPFAPILQTDSNHNDTLTSENQIDSMKLTAKCLARSAPPPPLQNLRLQLNRDELIQQNAIRLQNGGKPCEQNHTVDIPLNTNIAFDVPKLHAQSIIISEDGLITHEAYRETSSDIPSEPLLIENHSDNDNAEQLEDETEEDCNDIYSISRKRKRHICNKCQRIFNSRNALKYHHRTHTGFRPHQCDTCGKSFFAISALKAHVRTHTGDKPYDCAHCDQKFRQWSDLKYHFIAIHSNEKNHQCEFCGKSFSRKYSLVVHLRIHTGENNYKCEFCTKTFRASTYLQSHRKLHTGEKPYECDICSKKFRVSSDYSRHRRMHDRQKFK